MKTAIVCLVLAGWAARPGFAGDAGDFVILNPGPCIRASEPLLLQWEAGQRAFSSGAYGEARSAFLAGAAACPEDASARHMAALCSLALGDAAQAIRWLVQAERMPNSDVRVPLALAAAHTYATDEETTIGWLKRGLLRAAPDERAYWATRASFARLWSNRAPAFVALLEECDVPTDPDAASAAARPPAPPAPSVETAAPPAKRLLHLSYFDPSSASMDKVLFMKRQIEINLIKRIRDVEEEPEEVWEDPGEPEPPQEP